MILSATHPTKWSYKRLFQILVAFMGACALLSVSSFALAFDDSSLETVDHAQNAMTTALSRAVMAAPDKRDALGQKFNSYRNVVDVCAPDYEDRRKRPDLPPIDLQPWLSTHPDKWQCILNSLHEGTGLFNRVATEAKAGGLSAETQQALALATSQAPTKKSAPPPVVAVTVDPWSGTAAKLEHTGNESFLSYTDAAGASHRYAVARPKMMQGMATGDTGSWAYVAPDKSTGRIFDVGAGGNVQSHALSAMQIKLFMGQ